MSLPQQRDCMNYYKSVTTVEKYPGTKAKTKRKKQKGKKQQCKISKKKRWDFGREVENVTCSVY